MTIRLSNSRKEIFLACFRSISTIQFRRTEFRHVNASSPKDFMCTRNTILHYILISFIMHKPYTQIQQYTRVRQKFWLLNLKYQDIYFTYAYFFKKIYWRRNTRKKNAKDALHRPILLSKFIFNRWLYFALLILGVFFYYSVQMRKETATCGTCNLNKPMYIRVQSGRGKSRISSPTEGALKYAAKYTNRCLHIREYRYASFLFDEFFTHTLI